MTTDLAALADRIRRQRRIQRRVSVFTVGWILVAIVVSWMLFRLTEWNPAYDTFPFTWEWEVLRRALASGTFWLQPAQAIFQAPYISVGAGPFEIFGAVTLVTFITVGVVWLLYALPLAVSALVIRRGLRADADGDRGWTHVPVLAATLFPALETRAGRPIETIGSARALRVHFVGREVVVTTPSHPATPELVIDSRRNRPERRNPRRLVAAEDAEVVLDGTTHATSRLLVAPNWHDTAGVVFAQSLLAIVVKQLPHADIYADGQGVAVVVDAETIDDALELDRLLTSIVTFSDALDARIAAAAALPGRARRPRMPLPAVVESAQLRSCWLALRVRWPATIAWVVAGLVVATALITVVAQEGSLGDLIAVTAVTAAIAATTAGRRLRGAMVLEAPGGTDWFALALRTQEDAARRRAAARAARRARHGAAPTEEEA